MKSSLKSIKGFNVIELVITVVIVAVFASIAIPSYLDFTRRNYYSDIVQVAESYKTAVAQCYKKTKHLTGCNGGMQSIPANITVSKEAIATLTVVNGVIHIVPVKNHGVTAEDDYTLTPSVINQELKWAQSGGAVLKEYVDK